MLWNRFFDPMSCYFFATDDKSDAKKEAEDEDSDTEDAQDKDTENQDEDKEDDSEKEDEKLTPKQQALLNKKIGEARIKEREKLKKQSERADKEKEGKFEPLYNDAKKEIETLTSQVESLQEQLDEIHTQQNADISKAIKAWDKEIREDDPGEENPVERMKWFTKTKKIIDKFSGKKNNKDEYEKEPPDTDPGNRGTKKTKLDSTKGIYEDYSKNKYYRPGQSK